MLKIRRPPGKVDADLNWVVSGVKKKLMERQPGKGEESESEEGKEREEEGEEEEEEEEKVVYGSDSEPEPVSEGSEGEGEGEEEDQIDEAAKADAELKLRMSESVLAQHEKHREKVRKKNESKHQSLVSAAAASNDGMWNTEGQRYWTVLRSRFALLSVHSYGISVFLPNLCSLCRTFSLPFEGYYRSANND